MARPAKIICEQERSESADLRQGSSIRITPNIFFVDPDNDPHHSQNLITCSLSHLGHILKISSKSVHNFLSYLSLKITLIQKIQIVIRITPKIESFLPFTFSDISWKFHQNLSTSFWVILFTKKLTNPQTNPGENITSLAEVNMGKHPPCLSVGSSYWAKNCIYELPQNFNGTCKCLI